MFFENRKNGSSQYLTIVFFTVIVFTASISASTETEESDNSEPAENEKSGDWELADTEESFLKIRDKIIDLIEVELSQAYSFSQSSTHQVPHFEVLDRLHPKWHHGKPALARQFWVRAKYRAFNVFYRVDYVHVVNDAVVKIEGKKLITWTEQEDGPDLDKFWPFQFWASLQKLTHRDNTYLKATYPMRYRMRLKLNEKGEWVVAEERLKDNPEMLNNIKNHCMYEKQLADLGLKNDCNKKLLPQQ